MHRQQTLVYEEHADDIAAVSRALDLLGKQSEGAPRVPEAMTVLQGLIHRWIESQQPKLTDFDPRLFP